MHSSILSSNFLRAVRMSVTVSTVIERCVRRGALKEGVTDGGLGSGALKTCIRCSRLFASNSSHNSFSPFRYLSYIDVSTGLGKLRIVSSIIDSILCTAKSLPGPPDPNLQLPSNTPFAHFEFLKITLEQTSQSHSQKQVSSYRYSFCDWAHSYTTSQSASSSARYPCLFTVDRCPTCTSMHRRHPFYYIHGTN